MRAPEHQVSDATERRAHHRDRDRRDHGLRPQHHGCRCTPEVVLGSLVGASGQPEAYHKGEAKLQVDGANLAILTERVLKVTLAGARGKTANVQAAHGGRRDLLGCERNDRAVSNRATRPTYPLQLVLGDETTFLYGAPFASYKSGGALTSGAVVHGACTAASGQSADRAGRGAIYSMHLTSASNLD